MIESDRLQLVKKSNAKALQDNCVGLIIRNIFCFVDSFSYFSWSFVKRSTNKVAYVLANWQPMFVGSRL